MQANSFAALEKARHKKKSDQPKKEKKPKEPEISHEELEQRLFSQPVSLGIANWASDDESEDEEQHHHHHQEPLEPGWSKVGSCALVPRPGSGG